MPRKTTIPLYDGDDFERLAELRRNVAIAERNSLTASVAPRRAGDDIEDHGVQAAKDAYDAFVDEAAARAENWVLHAIGHEEWRNLLLAHPPRKVTQVDGTEAKEVDHPDDAELGVNTETFGRALLTFVDAEDPDHRTVIEPQLSASALVKRIKRLSVGEFESLWIAAYMLNNGAISDPKLARFSPDAQRSNAT